jgi:hypothetical protein
LEGNNVIILLVGLWLQAFFIYSPYQANLTTVDGGAFAE